QPGVPVRRFEVRAVDEPGRRLLLVEGTAGSGARCVHADAQSVPSGDAVDGRERGSTGRGHPCEHGHGVPETGSSGQRADLPGAADGDRHQQRGRAVPRGAHLLAARRAPARARLAGARRDGRLPARLAAGLAGAQGVAHRTTFHRPARERGHGASHHPTPWPGRPPMTLLKKPRSSTAVAKQITLKGVDVTLSITRGKIAIDKYYARVRQGEFIRWIPRFDEDFIIDFRRYD